MKKEYSQEQLYIKAQQKVKEIKGFYSHFLVTVLVIPFLIFINLEFVPDFHWFWFPIIGMTLGLFFHWLGVFGFERLGFGKNWEEKKIEEIMRKNNF